MAWDLLTKDYGLDPDRLFVTYYAGCGSVPMDKETKSIWESIGVKPERILPFGKENFWQMGPIGPCGPSTEIHYDHRGTNLDPGSEINGDTGLVVEIWNLVFMQYNKTQNGELERLPLSHVVDTGAGLERLCAVLNGKVSNYDTDLFQPVFGKVQELSKVAAYGGDFSAAAERDRCYRIFADHIRAITVALGDGILPQTNQKIRRLIQRTLAVSDQQFQVKSLSSKDKLEFLMESVTQVGDCLGHIFPETAAMKPEISKILSAEIDRFSEFTSKQSGKTASSSKSEIPEILINDFPALSRISKDDLNQVKEKGNVDGSTAYKWYESVGATQEAIEELCSAFGLTFDKTGMDQEMKRMKKMFRDEVTKEMIENEDRIFIRKLESLMALYNPQDSGGICNPTMNIVREANPLFVEWMFDGSGDPVEEISSNDKESHWVILNKTPFVPGDTDFESDRGVLVLENGCKLHVEHVRQLPSGWILHLIKDVPEIGLSRKAIVKKFEIDNSTRFGREMSIKAVAYLKWWLKKRYGVVRISNECALKETCEMTVTLLDGDLTLQDIHQLQNDSNEQGVALVVTKKSNPSKKVGTHELVCATGLAAEISLRFGQEVLDCLVEIQELCKEAATQNESFATKTKEVLKILVDRTSECVKRPDLLLPHEVYQEAEKVLHDAEKVLWKNQEQMEITRMIHEIAGIAQETKTSFVLKLFDSDHEFSSLKKVTRAADQKPILVLIKSSDDFVHGRCSVPKGLLESRGVSAEDWMKCFTAKLGKGVVAAPKGQDGRFQVNLKKIQVYDCQDRLGPALENARKYIEDRVDKKFIEDGASASSSDDKSSKSSAESVRLQ
ncbi:unnamed protein product [Orchesella dallaii]|uniref:alanine--tRNA ligase n=1 Tax=Orchesella dallaii TaxID=48710 RepID=A0ABP1RS72_9HEXA